MTMRRLEGWEIALSNFLLARRDMPFAWGTNDCAIFPADAVQVMTGTDLAAAWRGYTTKEQADALLAEAGSLEAYYTQAIGIAPHKNSLLARRGDPVLVETPQGITGGIVCDDGQRIACVSELHGLVRFRLNRATRIWSF